MRTACRCADTQLAANADSDVSQCRSRTACRALSRRMYVRQALAFELQWRTAPSVAKPSRAVHGLAFPLRSAAVARRLTLRRS